MGQRPRMRRRFRAFVSCSFTSVALFTIEQREPILNDVLRGSGHDPRVVTDYFVRGGICTCRTIVRGDFPQLPAIRAAIHVLDFVGCLALSSMAWLCQLRFLTDRFRESRF